MRFKWWMPLAYPAFLLLSILAFQNCSSGFQSSSSLSSSKVDEVTGDPILQGSCASGEVEFSGQCFVAQKPCAVNGETGFQKFKQGIYGVCVPTAPPRKELKGQIKLVAYYGSAENNGGGTKFAEREYSSFVQHSSSSVQLSWYDDEDLIYKVKKARMHGLGIVLAVANVFLNMGRDDAPLRDDYKARFDHLWKVLEPYHDSITGFYLYDEPFFNYGNITGAITPQDLTLKANIEGMANFLEGVAPHIPTIIVYSETPFTRPDFLTKLFIRNVDMIGVDCYLALGCTVEKLLLKTVDLINTKSPQQKLFVVPDIFATGGANLSEWDRKLVERNKFIMQLVDFHPDVVGMLPFGVASGVSINGKPPEWYAADSLPLAFADLTRYYQEVVLQPDKPRVSLVSPFYSSRFKLGDSTTITWKSTAAPAGSYVNLTLVSSATSERWTMRRQEPVTGRFAPWNIRTWCDARACDVPIPAGRYTLEAVLYTAQNVPISVSESTFWIE